jgi:hypothetical protein
MGAAPEFKGPRQLAIRLNRRYLFAATRKRKFDRDQWNKPAIC